jgi:hypothetical protein
MLAGGRNIADASSPIFASILMPSPPVPPARRASSAGSSLN